MANDPDQQLHEIEEFTRERPLAVPPARWETAFRTLWPLLAVDEPRSRSRAWKLLNECISLESTSSWEPDIKLRRLEELSRHVPPLPARAAMDVFKFCLGAAFLNDDEAIRDQLTHWIRRIHSSEGMQGDIGLACEYVIGVPHDRAELERDLRHPSAGLRAAASYRLAHMPFEGPELPQLIQDVEVQLGAVAGPFLHVLAYQLGELPFDPEEWILKILEGRRSSAANAEIPTIFMSLDFCAHELLAPRRKTIERLLAADAIEICRAMADDFIISAGDVPGLTARETAEWSLIVRDARGEKDASPETLLRLGSFYDLLAQKIRDNARR